MALVWIVVGSIFAGAVHDYLTGMLSIRHNGANVPEIVGTYLGQPIQRLMQVFVVVLLILVGVVFVSAPAMLLQKLTYLDFNLWLGIIFLYYFLATVLPIDKIIGKIYPLFGAILGFMAIGLITMLMIKGYEFYPAATWSNQHPADLPWWPLLFITIACGAISGFHAAQSPLMSRCVENEEDGKMVFYGGMIGEGIVALIWATLGMSFYYTPEALYAEILQNGPSSVVNDISITLMGPLGGVLAVIGVVVLPITSGDTAFRATRLTLSSAFTLNKKPTGNVLQLLFRFL